MGTKGRALVGKDVDKLIEMLNKALADEWLAYYQYWVGAKVVKGPMREGEIAPTPPLGGSGRRNRGRSGHFR